MKIIATTCDEYLHILKGFVYMFNRHWSSSAEVTILGYSVPSFGLPDNFKFISLGEQRKYGRDWTTALVPFFKQLPNDYFILLLEDIYILDVNKSLLCEAEKHMAKGADKVYFTIGSRQGISGETDANFNIIHQTGGYRLSLQPSFIRKDYFLKYLNPGKSIWQYETQHEAPKNDGARTLVPKQDIISYSDFMNKGKISRSGQIAKIREEDLNAIKHLGVF